MRSLLSACFSLIVMVNLNPCFAEVQPPPNILFIIADDASCHFGKAYHCEWVNTPHIDQVAQEGIVFDNFYVVSAKCAPCRAALLTGRNSWQNEDAANHQNFFPAALPVFSEVLKKNGFAVGKKGKVWGPGRATDLHGQLRDFDLPEVPAGSKATPHLAFEAFLEDRSNNQPFFFWYGSSDPHRGYESGAGQKSGKKPDDIDHVPAYWPDNDTVRNDMLDYATEIERFDSHVGEMLNVLDRFGLRETTLVIVTSDHGMPFPRVKGHTFDDAHRVPTVMRWPRGIKNPGRRISELLSFIDFAPTFLSLAGIPSDHSGMDLTGHSFVDLLDNMPTQERSFLLIGRERNDVYARPGSIAGLGYPARGIRSGDYLFVYNFCPERWPCGNPELGLKDTDGSPTKSLIMDRGPGNKYWEHAFGKRPQEMLFNVKKDPDCVINLAANDAYAGIQERLRRTMFQELERQGDPRVLGDGHVFDHYPTVKKVPKGWDEHDEKNLQN